MKKIFDGQKRKKILLLISFLCLLAFLCCSCMPNSDDPKTETGETGDATSVTDEITDNTDEGTQEEDVWASYVPLD